MKYFLPYLSERVPQIMVPKKTHIAFEEANNPIQAADASKESA